MKIALSQMDITWLDIRANTTKISNHIEQADASGAGAIVFPEMALTGFCMDPARAAIDPVSPEMRALTLATRGKRILVMAGAAVRQNGLSYNMFLFIQGGEIVAGYSKINLFPPTGEDRCYTPGGDLIVVDYGGIRIAPLVCFDMRFPQLFCALQAVDTDIFVVMASWPAAEARQWQTLLSARAVDTQAYLIGVNRIGSGGGMEFCGQSMAVSPGGKPLFEYTTDERLIFVDIDPSRSARLREDFPVFKKSVTGFSMQPRVISLRA